MSLSTTASKAKDIETIFKSGAGIAAALATIFGSYVSARKHKKELDKLNEPEAGREANEPQLEVYKDQSESTDKAKEWISSGRPWSQLVDDPVMDLAIKACVWNPSVMKF